jgi:hypothetical protein
MLQGRSQTWKVNIRVEKSKAPAEAEAYLLPHMVDELLII